MEKKDIIKTGLITGALFGVAHIASLITVDAVIKLVKSQQNPSSEGKKENDK